MNQFDYSKLKKQKHLNKITKKIHLPTVLQSFNIIATICFIQKEWLILAGLPKNHALSL